MEKPWFDKLRKVTPYVPGEQSKNIVKLNANENPYPPSPMVLKALKEFDGEGLKLYPDANSKSLVEALANYHNVEKEEIFVANGSDDVIALCYLSFFNSEKPIFFPDITYSFYPVWCDFFKVSYETKAVDENFEINPKDYYGENGGVIIPNPNAPTGMGKGKAFIEEIMENNKDVIVIIDEAYVDFGAYSSVELINKYENLIIVQTFSKSRSLAGLRIGVAIGNKELIALLNAVKNCYNSYALDSVAIKCGTECVLDDGYFKETLNKIIKTRKWTAEKLESLGFEVYPSEANFIFVTHKTINAKELFEALRAENIFIRYFNLPRIDNHLRITIGTDEEMEKLINFIENHIK